ncbi:MAG: hypothetical protein K2X97_19370, partial [Mycobacteriaceae bacterium]|nr:hypothetical protein [Mycobacteriaceae bacterium]
VTERLALLRMNRDELSRRGGPQRSTLRKARTESRKPTLATLTRLDETLGWAPGSSAAILEGGQPVCAHHQDPQVRAVLEAAEGLIQECSAMLIDARKLLSEVLQGDARHAS